MKLNLSALMSVATAGAIAVGLTACIDNDYDLSDIDSTVQVIVKDLTVPVNLGAITLNQVLDLEPGDDIKEINGEYAVLKEGDFSSSRIHVEKVSIKSNPINPSSVDIHNDGETSDVPEGLEIPVGAQSYTYSMKEPSLSDFEFTNNNVDYRIKGLDYINVDWNITFNLEVKDPNKTFQQYCFRNVRLELPEGFVFGDAVKDLVVSPTELALPQIVFSKGVTQYKLDLPIVAINFKRMIETGVGSFSAGATQKAPSALQIKGKMGVKSGEILAVTNDVITTGSTLELVSTPTTTNILINDFTGKIAYDIEGLKVNDVDLSSLPDFLSGDQTNLFLSNPQLYLSTNNPAGKFKGEPSTGLELIPIRYNAQGKEVQGTPVSPEKDIVIGSDYGEGPYRFCLSPKKPKNFYEGYTDAETIDYPALSDVLSGDGVPKKLRVKFVDPCLDGYVTDFPLGVDLPTLDGNYTMYCPLSLANGSSIVYASDETGWGKDVQKVTVQKLNVTALCKNDLPFDVTFRNCYPLDANGKRIQKVTISEVTVRSGENQEINIEVTGEFSNFDGIHFEAVAAQTSDDTLKPDTNIKLTDIRAKVTGYYIDTL